MAIRLPNLQRLLFPVAAAVTLNMAMSGGAQAGEPPIKVGLVAALSGQSAKSGEALTRGLTMAINEVNASGGVLGRPLELVRRDDESNPSKGMLAARELVQREKVAVLFGGLDTPVSLAIVPLANQMKVPFMGIWAAGTKITENGAADNYVFRVSAVDELVDEALVKYGVDHGMHKPGMILINNPWGESNEAGFKRALEKRGLANAGVERIQDSDLDVVPQLTRLKNAGADTLLLVGNVGPRHRWSSLWTAWAGTCRWSRTGGRPVAALASWRGLMHPGCISSRPTCSPNTTTPKAMPC